MLAQETEGAVLVKISTDVGKEIFPTTEVASDPIIITEL